MHRKERLWRQHAASAASIAPTTASTTSAAAETATAATTIAAKATPEAETATTAPITATIPRKRKLHAIMVSSVCFLKERGCSNLIVL